MSLKLLLPLVALSLVAARTQLTGCLDDGKYCVGLPKGCLGPQCIVAFGSKSNGTHSEVEILGTNILDKTWLGIGYSADKEMKDDIVIFCIRDDKTDGMQSRAGVAYNTDHNNEMIGTAEELQEDHKKDRFNLNLDVVEYDKSDKTLYCKMTHRIDSVIEHFNMTNVEILIAKGVWMKGAISYHGKTRNHVGIIDISGHQKKPKKSATSATALLSSAVTFLVAKFFF